MIRLIKLRPEKPQTDYQKIFAQSRLYGARYDGEQLPVHPWRWPSETFLDRKLRKEQPCSDR